MLNSKEKATRMLHQLLNVIEYFSNKEHLDKFEEWLLESAEEVFEEMGGITLK